MSQRPPEPTSLTSIPITQISDLLEGAMGLRMLADGVQPIRLPIEGIELHHRSLLDPFTAEAASGVRLRFRTTSRVVVLEVTHKAPEQFPGAPVYDLVLEDGTIRRSVAGDDQQPRFDDLPAGDKVVEIWLPPGLGVVLHRLALERGAIVEPSPHPGPRWVTYGSSITHGAWLAPTDTWPSVAARRLGWNLTSLAYNGGCHLDPLVARAMAAVPADGFTLEIGTNIHTDQTMRERTFGPGVHGFLATLRDRHPATPITVVSPILAPDRETSPVSVLPTLAEPLVGDLTMQDIRTVLRDVVELLRARGDETIDYLDGRDLLGPTDVDRLPDGLHPDAEGHALIGGRFATRLASV